jgi:hypothetical protein
LLRTGLCMIAKRKHMSVCNNWLCVIAKKKTENFLMQIMLICVGLQKNMFG